MWFWTGLIIGFVLGVLTILGFGLLYSLVMDHLDDDDEIDYWESQDKHLGG